MKDLNIKIGNAHAGSIQKNSFTIADRSSNDQSINTDHLDQLIGQLRELLQSSELPSEVAKHAEDEVQHLERESRLPSTTERLSTISKCLSRLDAVLKNTHAVGRSAAGILVSIAKMIGIQWPIS